MTNPIDEHKTYWIAKNGDGSGQQRKIHFDEGCYLLKKATNSKEATQREIEMFDTCPACDPGKTVPTGPKKGRHQTALRAAARNREYQKNQGERV